MPLMPVSHFTWQLLRTLERSEGPLTGRQLRLIPNRATKDGTFLDRLVEEGLLEVVGVDPLPEGASGPESRQPAQFRTRYRLAARGAHAAEYGEYEREVLPPRPARRRPPPLRGGGGSG